MATFKLKDKNGVETTYTKSGIKIPNADGTGYVTFSEGLSGAYTISLNTGSGVWQVIQVMAGETIDMPTKPKRTGYAFGGWSTVNGATTPNVTFPYTPTGDITLYAVWTTWSCTVEGLGIEAPTSVTFTHDGTMPTFEEVTFNGDKFIKIPTMYRKVNTWSDAQITSFTIAMTNIDGTYEPYSCFIKEDGVSVMEYVLIGKYYSNSSTVCNSQSTSVAAQTIGTGRTNARARGTGYQLYDWQMQKLWQDLIICKMNTIDTNSGSGLENDDLGFYWATGGHWIDGIASPASGNYWTFSYKPSKYVDSPSATTDGYKQVNYNRPTASGNITALGYDPSEPFMNYPKTASGTSYTTYYCDAYTYSNGSHPVRSNIGDRFATSPGAFYCYTSDTWSSTRNVRLCYRPIGE